MKMFVSVVSESRTYNLGEKDTIAQQSITEVCEAEFFFYFLPGTYDLKDHALIYQSHRHPKLTLRRCPGDSNRTVR